MKILHTPIKTEKVGRKFIAKCQILPENWKAKPIDYEQKGDTAEIAKAKAIDFLSSGGEAELQEVETFEKPQENGKETANSTN